MLLWKMPLSMFNVFRQFPHLFSWYTSKKCNKQLSYEWKKSFVEKMQIWLGREIITAFPSTHFFLIPKIIILIFLLPLIGIHLIGTDFIIKMIPNSIEIGWAVFMIYIQIWDSPKNMCVTSMIIAFKPVFNGLKIFIISSFVH